jgi:hypothetical protein
MSKRNKSKFRNNSKRHTDLFALRDKLKTPVKIIPSPSPPVVPNIPKGLPVPKSTFGRAFGTSNKNPFAMAFNVLKLNINF